MRFMQVFLFTLLALGLTTCATKKEQTTPSKAEIIGSASMGSYRMITVILRAEDGHGMVGDTAFFMNPGHKDYKMTIEHVGGLKPGQSKPYPACSQNSNP